MNREEFYLADAIDVIREVLASDGEFRLYPKGTSMLPLLKESEDSVVLRRRKETPAQKHDIAFYRRDDGHFVLHRVMKCEADGTYTMCGDNQTVLEKAVRSDQIIGYVHQIYKKEKLLSLNSFKYRMYVHFWTCMPLRYMVRFPFKVLSALKRRLKKLFKKQI